jgi:Helicase HerA, central domain
VCRSCALQAASTHSCHFGSPRPSSGANPGLSAVVWLFWPWHISQISPYCTSGPGITRVSTDRTSTSLSPAALNERRGYASSSHARWRHCMKAVLAILGVCLVIGGVVVLARWLDGVLWRRSLLAFRLTLPGGLKIDDVARWLTLVNGSTHATRFPLLPTPPVALEIVATSRGISHFILVPRALHSGVLAGVRAALPGARLEEVPDYFSLRARHDWAAEATVTNQRRPLRGELAQTASSALLAALQPLAPPDVAVVQWLITGGGIPRIVTPPRAGSRQVAEWWRSAPPDSEAMHAERVKQEVPLLRAAVRVGVASPDRTRRYAAFGRIWATLRTLNGSGVGVVRRWWLIPSVAAFRVNSLMLPLLGWPMTLNAVELAGLLGLPTGDNRLPGLPGASSRQLPPVPGMASSGAVFGVSNYPGMTTRRLAVRVNDRLRHTWVVGPTGSGKSTLLGNLILQDMEAGAGLVVVDARGDLVPDILARAPSHRQDDIIVIDPSETARPVGFNILRIGSDDEQGRERAVDHVLHVFADIYRASWGPRTADILRNGLLTLTSTRARDGSAFTLCELPELLTNASFRRYVTSQPAVTGALSTFWHSYDSMTEAQRAEVIGPVLNKLRAFVLSSSLRLLLGQSEGIDLGDVFRKRRIVLVRLGKGSLGIETAQLVGSLLVASVWQVTLGRLRVPAERRRPAWLYADEFQETVRLPIDLADMLAQARGFGLGLTLAHQYLGQLPEAVKAAVLATARTQVLFQLDYDDARAMEQRFAPLSRQDLSGLGAYEIALRPCIAGRTGDVVTATTYPMSDANQDATALATRSRERYGVPRAHVDAALQARITVTEAALRRGGQPWAGTA